MCAVRVWRVPDNWVVGVVTAISAGLKVVLAAATYGTNDMTSWIHYADYVSANGSISVYADIPLYNHPPLVSFWLIALTGVVGGADSDLFPFVFRLLPIAADVGSAIVLWKAAQTFLVGPDALRRTVVAVLSPVLVMVSGFHGNTDSVFGFCVLAAAYLLAVRHRLVPAALMLALALNIKIIPILTVPAFVVWIPLWRDRWRFAVTTTAAAACGYFFHFLSVPTPIVRNIFQYASLEGIWGFGMLLPDGAWRGQALVLTAALVLFWAVRAGLQNRPVTPLSLLPTVRSEGLFRALALTMLTFLAFTPGFGVQYLSWAAALVVFVGFRWGLAFTACGSVFLALVYTHWSGGVPWNYANSWQASPWTATIQLWGLAAWGTTLLPVLVNLLSAGRRAPNGQSFSAPSRP